MSSSLAPEACVSCKSNKRKCSKELPSCLHCLKTRRKCLYAAKPSVSAEIQRLRRKLSSLERSAGSTSVISANETQSEHLSLSSIPLLTITAAGSIFTSSRHDLTKNQYAEPDLFRYPQLRQPFVNSSVTNDVSTILGGFSTVLDNANVFYDTVHSWMPVISKARYTADLADLASQPRAETALLALCVALIIQSPENCKSENMRTSLYANARSIMAFVESAGILSIRTVQSMLLISLYELGHGLESAAHASICHTAAAAQTLGLHELCSDKQDKVEDESAFSDLEEARRVWWGIVILDRYFNLQTSNIRFATHVPSVSYRLPREDDQPQNEGDLLNVEPLLLSIPARTRVGPFTREAQVAYLLGRVLTHAYDPTPDDSFNLDEAATLQSTLDAFKKLLPEEIDIVRCSRYCGAIGICNSAILLLNRAVSSRSERRGSNSTTESYMLHSATSTVVETARNFERLIESGALKVEALSPLGLHSIFQAATSQAMALKESGDLSYVSSYKSLTQMLHVLNTRWKKAGTWSPCW